MKVKTSLGVYDINYAWDKAEVIEHKGRYGVRVSYAYTPIVTIACTEEEIPKVLSKLSKDKNETKETQE